MTTWWEPKSVTIRQQRWHLFITVVDDQGVAHAYVASADAYYTERDRLWFGTVKEWEKYE